MDIFFTPYLRDLVSRHLNGKAISQVIVPEFPIKRKGDNRSVKVDYVLFAADGSEVYFVELKTDSGSHRKEQWDYLTEASKRGFPQLLKDLRTLISGTTSHQKYFHLLHLLAQAKQVELRDDMAASLYPKVKRGFCFNEACFQPVESNAAIRVIFIEPESKPETERDSISFAHVCEFLKTRDDGVSQLLAEFIGKWSSAAGSSLPEVFNA